MLYPGDETTYLSFNLLYSLEFSSIHIISISNTFGIFVTLTIAQCWFPVRAIAGKLAGTMAGTKKYKLEELIVSIVDADKVPAEPLYEPPIEAIAASAEPSEEADG